jgi:NADPH:quinone reductase-like Zn-dependent oxidoreductase
MKAVAVLKFKGTPELLETDEPRPDQGQLLVRMEAAGVNPFDWKILDGIFDGRRPHVFPLIAGVDGAGIVEAVGAGVRKFRVGDRVAGSFLHDPIGTGTYAERATVPETNAVTHVPAPMTAAQAAAAPTAGITALEVVDLLKVPAKGTLLIVGASGGVGSLATAIAAGRGISVVATAHAGSEDHVRSLGAAEVVDAASPDLPALVRRSHPDGVDGLLDVGSDKPTFARYAQLVRRGGTAVTTTFVADPSAGQADGVRRINYNLEPQARTLERLFSEVTSGHLTVPIARTLPLAEGPRALADSRARTSVGKTVLTIP